MFDAKVYLESIAAPKFVDLNGKIHYGRVLGADTWLGLQQDLRIKRADGTVDMVALERTIRRIVGTIFPHPWWKIWKHSVLWHLKQLPSIGRMRAVWDFMHSQSKEMGQEMGPFPGSEMIVTPPSVKPDAPSPDLQTHGS